jgi:2-dehydropantoate 2-reductase
VEARYRKLAWNLAFNGLCLVYDVTTDGIVSDAERKSRARALAEEAVAIGNAALLASGRPAAIEPEWAEEQIRRTETMGAYAPSTLLDARAGRPLETDALFFEAKRRADRLGVHAPALAWLTETLRTREA